VKPAGALSIAFLGAVSVHGQGGLTGPSSGFLFDAPSKTVRLMHGALGSTSLGDPVLERVDTAIVSPTANRAIGCRRGDCFVVADLTSQEIVTLPLTSTPENVAWAPDGTGAILYSRTGGWIQPLHFFASGPELGQVWNVPGPGSLLAVAFDGSRTVLSISGDSGGIFEVTAASGLLRLSDVQSAVALTAKSGTVYALDGATPAVIRLSLQGGPSDRWDLPLTDPVTIQFSAGALYVGGQADHAVLAMDPQTGQIKQRTDLSFEPSRLDLLPGGSFLLTTRSGPDSVLWSFTPGRGTYFIPAPPLNEDVPTRGRRR
jgi:hypothetical protein